MRPFLLIAGLAALVAAPATASCHACLADVVEECGSLGPSDCQDSGLHLAEHAPGLVMDIVRDPSPFLCDSVETFDCPSSADRRL